MGWALGSNDAANVFGTAVASRMVRYRTAVILAAVFIMLGATLQGAGGIRTLSGLTAQNKTSAFLVAIAAAVTVISMTRLKLPVSTSQAVIGAILGIGFVMDAEKVPWGKLIKVIVCWIGTPVGATVLAFILYPVLAWCLARLRLNFVARSRVLKAALIAGGCYGAYALGANNVANVTGVFYGKGLFGDNVQLLAFVGGVSIALGVLTYSRGVMFTVGSRLVQLDAFSALVAVLAQAATVHIYAFVGVPVSTSQAVVGAVLGIGLFKGVKTINGRTLVNILLGWVSTPLIAGAIAFAAAKMFL